MPVEAQEAESDDDTEGAVKTEDEIETEGSDELYKEVIVQWQHETSLFQIYQMGTLNFDELLTVRCMRSYFKWIEMAHSLG